MTTIVGPVVTEVSGEKWPGVCAFPSLVFLPLPLRPQHNWTAVTIPQLAPTPSDSGHRADTTTERRR